MIGILLAMQVNNWNNRKIESKSAKQFHQNFKRQILEDLAIIKGALSYNLGYINQYKHAIKLIEEE